MLYTHLQPYVRHIEVWVPVWEKREGHCPALITTEPSPTGRHGSRAIVSTLVNANTTSFEETNNINLVYQLASHNATISEIFHCIKCLFPEACILTIEGGHCKKPPMIQHFRESGPLQSSTPKLAVLPSLRTLIFKGAWNIMREDTHFRNLSTALPNMREWHCTYAKPKTNAYKTICSVLQTFPPTLTHINICLEGFYGKESASPYKWRNLYSSHHICQYLGRVAPQLEALTFTGRICGSFFTSACQAARQKGPNGSRLRSLDLVVKNCCRPANVWNDGTGISNWAFIQAFEALVVAGVKSLSTLIALSTLRIRFIDLDTPCPLLNPYFQLKGNQCTGIWSDEILALLEKGRPEAGFVELHDVLGCVGLDKEGRLEEKGLRGRPSSIKVEGYRGLAEGGTLYASA